MIELASVRDFPNPPCRAPIRADFPAVADLSGGVAQLLSRLAQELAKRNTSLHTVGSINVIYPQKHPVREAGHFNRAVKTVTDAVTALRREFPFINWTMVEAFYERHSFSRTKDQSALRALTCRQEYGVDPDLQKQILPFLYGAMPGRDYFVMIDDTFWQGTTLANLAGFIEFNGGTVLLAAAESFGTLSHHLAQQSAPLWQIAGGGTEARGRLPELGRAFAASARQDGYILTPDECLAKFNGALEPHGKTAASLTDGECVELIQSMSRQETDTYKRVPLSFNALCRQLRPGG